MLCAEKDFNLPKHPEMDVPNLQVIKLMQSFKSRELVIEQFSWRHYYWKLTDKGIEFLREYLALPAEIVPATLKKTTRAIGERPRPAGPGGDMGGDRPRRFEGREGYRGAGGDRPGGGFGRGAAPGDKAGAPGAFKPTFA